MMKEKKGITTSEQLVVLAIVVGVIGVGIVFVLQKYSHTPTEDNEYTTFSSSKYGFSFTYPPSWVLADNSERYGSKLVLVQENSTEGQPKARVQFAAGRLRYPPLDNLRNEIENSFENNENITIISDLKDITVQGSQGIEISYISMGPQDNMRVRMRILKRGDSDYLISYFAEENTYSEFESELTQIVDSFTFLEE